MTDALVQLRQVSKVYRSGEVPVHVLQGVDLEIERGRLAVVVGPSGSGKSTLLNLIGGIDRPTSGAVHSCGLNLDQLNDQELTLYRREHVGFVFQFYNLIPSLTAIENVAVSSELRPRGLGPEEAIQLVGLQERRDHFPAQLSGGEQQRVAIARAVVGHPQLLLCDEPTGALDLETGRVVLQLLARLTRESNLTVVLITHNSPIAAMADQLIRIGGGTITEDRRNPNPIPAGEVTW
jgi:putative ABC transport system ATP-binding protein